MNAPMTLEIAREIQAALDSRDPIPGLEVRDLGNDDEAWNQWDASVRSLDIALAMDPTFWR